MPEAVIFEDSLYKGDPLMQYLDGMLGPDSSYDQESKNAKLKLNIGITNLVNGTFVSFN